MSGATYLVSLSDTGTQIDLFRAPYNGSAPNFGPVKKVLGDAPGENGTSDKFDKDWITVDNWQSAAPTNLPDQHQGTIWVTFNLTRQTDELDSSYTSGIYLVYSPDGGTTWDNYLSRGSSLGDTYDALSNTGQPVISAAQTAYDEDGGSGNLIHHTVDHNPFGAQVVIGADHLPFVIWWESQVDTRLGNETTETKTEQLMWTHEVKPLGSTSYAWTKPTVLTSEIWKEDSNPDGLKLHADPNVSADKGPADANSLPQAIVNPVNGDIYVTWSDGVAEDSTADRGDIKFAQLSYTGSGSGYATSWSPAPGGLDGGDSNDQWDPAMAVSPDGRDVFVGYYSRAAAADDQYDDSGLLINAYGIIGMVGSSGSITWGTPTALTTTAFRQPHDTSISGGLTKMGDYNCASASDQSFYYAFTDGGNSGGPPQIQMAIVPIEAASDVPATPSTPAIASISSGGATTVQWSNSGSYSSSNVMEVEISDPSHPWALSSTTADATDGSVGLGITIPNFSSTTSYYFRLRAHNGSGYSAYSNIFMVLAAPNAANTFGLLRNGSDLLATIGSSTLYNGLLSAVSGILVIGNSGADTLTIDQSGGIIAPDAGIRFNGNGGTNNLIVRGNSSSGALSVSGTSATAGSLTFVLSGNTSTVNYTNCGQIDYSSAGGDDSLSVTGSTPLGLDPGSASGPNAIYLSSLSIGDGAKVIALSATSHANRSVLVVPNASLTVTGTGTVDMHDNDMIVISGTYAHVGGMVTSGFAAFAWNGPGVSSSTAAARGITALGFALAGEVGVASFDGVYVAGADMLVKYTYFGDSTIDGMVNGDDYSTIDFFNGTATGAVWAYGDFTFDGAVNGDDYSIIDFTNGDGTAGNANPQL